MSDNRNKDKDTHATGRRNTPKGDRPSKVVDKRGMPKLQEHVPGPDTFVGTPGWIKGAVRQAEALTGAGKLDCGYGKQEVHGTHRKPESTWSAGKPDYRKGHPEIRKDTGRESWHQKTHESH